MFKEVDSAHAGNYANGWANRSDHLCHGWRQEREQASIYDFGVLDGLIDSKAKMGTGNIAKGPAMTEDEAAIKLAFAFWIKATSCSGQVIWGSATLPLSSAIAAVIIGAPVADVTGKGTGISDEMLATKTKVIQDAIHLNEPIMHHAKPARKDGLGRIFIGRVGPGVVAISSGIVVLLILLMVLINPVGGSPVHMAVLCVSFCVVLYFLNLMAVKFLTKRFGGLTGDHFGALTEVSEVLFLLVAYPWLRHSF